MDKTRLVLVFKKGENVNLAPYGAPNFNSSEFDCKCKDKYCNYTFISLTLLEFLQWLRDETGKAIYVNRHPGNKSAGSAYRCVKHNKKEGGGTLSFHMAGMAGDLSVDGMTPDEVVELIKTKAKDKIKGLGLYNTFSHTDTGWWRESEWDKRSK